MPTPTTTTLTESGAVSAPEGTRAGNMLIQIITPGVGSSGVYPAEVLEAAAADKVFSKGLLMFADHPGESERYDRPERSIRDVAGVLVEDAYWDGAALVAEARTYEPWTQVLSQMADAIGVSIRAGATVTESTTGGPPTIDRITHVTSVDFVTQAGRGGAIRQVYESARAEAPLVVVDEGAPRRVRTAQEIAEALPGGLTANDLRSALDDAVQDAYGAAATAGTQSNPGAPGVYTWVRDWTDTWVVFSTSSDDGADLWQQGYTVATTGEATLTGERTEVQAKTSYVALPPDAATEARRTPARVADAALHRALAEARAPMPPRQPAGSTPTTTPPGGTMPDIEEGRLQAYQLAEARVPQLERELAEAKTSAEKLQRDLAEAKAGVKARDFATKLVESANGDLGPAAVAKIVAESTRSIPLNADLTLDTEALTESVNAEREAMESFLASVATQQGMGTVRGVGPGSAGGSLFATEAARQAVLDDIFA